MAVVVELLMLIWEAHICRSSWILSHGCEVFRGIAEVHHWWHIRLTNLTNTSQATEDLVLDNCKSASPRRNKVSFLTELLVSTKGKNTCQHSSFFAAGEIWRCPSEYLLHLVLLSFRSNWGIPSINAHSTEMLSGKYAHSISCNHITLVWDGA
jgi:hypothetical protein